VVIFPAAMKRKISRRAEEEWSDKGSSGKGQLVRRSIVEPSTIVAEGMNAYHCNESEPMSRYKRDFSSLLFDDLTAVGEWCWNTTRE